MAAQEGIEPPLRSHEKRVRQFLLHNEKCVLLITQVLIFQIRVLVHPFYGNPLHYRTWHPD